ncbi:MAG: flavodoxin domain-containing protein [Planctomycetota bacterium]
MPDASDARVLLVYTTETNSTRQMAEAVAAGVDAVEGVRCQTVCLVDGTEVEAEDLPGYDGLIVGTPVRHRNMHHRVKRFIEITLESLWLRDRTVGMVGGVFCVGGGHGDTGAGAEQCLLGILAAMASNGLITAPLPKCTPGFDHAGNHWGPVGRSGGPKMQPYWLSPDMLRCARAHGGNIARLTLALRSHHTSLFEAGNVAPPSELAEAFLMGGRPEVEQVPPPDENVAYRVDPPEGYPSGSA